jgi:hypothetical protein
MSFSKTVSSVAALTTIFGASIAAWKVVQYNQNQTQIQPQTKQLEQKIVELQQELENTKKTQEKLFNSVITPAPPSPQPEFDTDEK